jgi:DNA (cytosine-5)-methyltransferase 1
MEIKVVKKNKSKKIKNDMELNLEKELNEIVNSTKNDTQEIKPDIISGLKQSLSHVVTIDCNNTKSIKNNKSTVKKTKKYIADSENNDEELKDNKLKFIDLFCGIGGFHQALKKLNYECVFASDIDVKCRNIYKLNYNLLPEGDISKIDIKTIPNFDILCGGFPCFIAGTKTLTNNGYKNIEDVKITDKLLTHNGKFQSILNLQKKIYTGDLFDIKIKYHPELITSTKEHPFYVREKKQNIFENPCWKKANELTMNDYFGMVINDNKIIPEFTFNKLINQHKTEQIYIKLDNLDYWFVMGYFVGDGWIEETTKKNGRCMYKIRFAINNKQENYVLEKINKVINITDKKNDTGKCKKFGCSNFMWYNIFKQFGKYAHKKLIPEWIQDAPKEFIQEFINGYMTADGCINNENILQVTTVSLNLAYGLQRLYLKLGYIFSINKTIRSKTCVIEGHTVNQRDTYCIRGILQKKRNSSSFIENNYVWFAPSKITNKKTTEIPVYNFEVENDNSYVVMNTLVHNCQPFSKAGDQMGFDDHRGNLFFNICKIAEYHKPKYMILENVRNLATHDNGNTWKIIYNKIIKMGYLTYSEPIILNVLHFNIPQNRERVIILCKRKDLGNLPELPNIPTNPKKTLTVQIKDIIDNSSDNSKYKIDGKLKDVEKIWNNFISVLLKNKITIPKFPIWTDMWDCDLEKHKEFYKKYKNWIDKNREFYNNNIDVLKKWLKESRKNENWFGAVRKFEWQAGDLLENDSLNTVLWTARGSGIRVKRLDYIPTLVAMSMIPVYGPESRKLSPRELLRLQSFPDNFKYDEKSIYKQVGNAVNVKMIEKCAKFLVLNEKLF